MIKIYFFVLRLHQFVQRSTRPLSLPRHIHESSRTRRHLGHFRSPPAPRKRFQRKNGGESSQQSSQSESSGGGGVRVGLLVAVREPRGCPEGSLPKTHPAR